MPHSSGLARGAWLPLLSVCSSKLNMSSLPYLLSSVFNLVYSIRYTYFCGIGFI